MDWAANLYRNLSEEAARLAAETRLEGGIAVETKEIWRAMQAVPVADRAAWLRSEEAETLREDLYFIRRERDRVPDNDDRDGSRLHEQPVKRVYGARDRLITETALQLSLLLQRDVSESSVRKALKARLNSDPI